MNDGIYSEAATGMSKRTQNVGLTSKSSVHDTVSISITKPSSWYTELSLMLDVHSGGSKIA